MGLKYPEVAKLIVCLGVGMILSSVFSLYIIDEELLAKLNELVQGNRMFFDVCLLVGLLGLMLIFYGVAYLMATKRMLRNNKFQILAISYFFFGAIFFMSIVLIHPNGFHQFFLYAFSPIAIALFFGGIVYVLMNLVSYSLKLLVTIIQDPKDRITAMIAIFGTIISMIALFK